MALSQGGTTLVLVSCDLIGVGRETTRAVRRLVNEAVGLEEAAVMVHCTHTHSGPATDRIHGWGVVDEPYLEVLPQRLARAAITAVESLTEAELHHAEVPCQGIALNREYDRDAPPLEEVLRDDWRPAHPELTDATCHVFTATAGGRLLGFASSYGCHPVVCCQETRYLHGDFVGVATNLLEREHPGSVGLFLQGAQGDVNSCVVHKPEPESLLALDVIAARYANCVRAGLRQAAPLKVDRLSCALEETTFARVPADREMLTQWLAEQERVVHAPGASDAEHAVRMATVYVLTLRNLLRKLDAGEPLATATELQAFQIGPVLLLGTPFEVFQQVKRDALAAVSAPIRLLLGLTNDSQGYAPDRTTAERGGYAAQMVPIMKGSLPYQDIHGELVARLRELATRL